MADLPQLKRIIDPIADDHWSYGGPDGMRVTSRVSVGRPQPWPRDTQGDWICPVSIEHFTDGVTTVAGVGPVDALMNAMALVKAFAEQVGQFTPRASEARQGRKQPSSAVSAKRPRSAKKISGRTNTRIAHRKRSTA
jgi:hypothetical protein